MKVLVALALCMLAATEAGIVSPLFYPHPGNALFYPVELRKVVPYPPKPVITGYPTQIFKTDVFGVPHLYTFPVVQPQVTAPASLILLPTVRTAPSTLVANAKAASGAGVAGSSVVAHSDEAVPFSVVANAGPGAAYSSAVLHPSAGSGPVTAGAQASVTGGH